MYYRGRGTIQNYRQALHWYQKAAEQGDSDAQIILALMYGEGQGIKRNFPQAEYWLKKAAAQGNPVAQKILQELSK